MVNAVKILKEYNIKPSFIRAKILRHLMSSKAHPSVDDIFMKLINEIPTLSKTTVYNTLALFVQNGLAMSINIDDTEKRYDADIQEHGHFMCEICSKVYDFPISADNVVPTTLDGFYIKGKNVYYKGACRSCQNKN